MKKFSRLSEKTLAERDLSFMLFPPASYNRRILESSSGNLLMNGRGRERSLAAGGIAVEATSHSSRTVSTGDQPPEL